MIEAVISDFGGVLTTSVDGAIAAAFAESGVSLEDLGQALLAAATARGANPIEEMECGRLSEADFLSELGTALAARLGRSVDLSPFPERMFAAMAPNVEFLRYLQTLRDGGYRMAICTNNVREWSRRWQTMIPVDELFEIVVDSSAVGMRKPDPRIYELVLAQLGVDASRTLFVDDLQINCEAATAQGMHAVRFLNTEQATAEIAAALGGAG